MPTLTYIDLERPETDALASRYAVPEDHAAAARYRRPLRCRQSLVAKKTDLTAAEENPVRIRLDRAERTLAHWFFPENYCLAVAIGADSLPEPKYFVPR